MTGRREKGEGTRATEDSSGDVVSKQMGSVPQRCIAAKHGARSGL
jgi:hypothetical protein